MMAPYGPLAGSPLDGSGTDLWKLKRRAGLAIKFPQPMLPPVRGFGGMVRTGLRLSPSPDTQALCNARSHLSPRSHTSHKSITGVLVSLPFRR
jgi:hypothetical protein